ncbi:MAG: hypothetical protein P9L99_15235 [Candidatus Lernaella stagnicola]|nr:hypothetical protein [Candidatus Lernaella stagnicola]
MQWLLDNWQLCVFYCQEGAYFSALLSPIGIALSLLVVVLGAVLGNMRKTLWMTVFAVWFLVPLHHFTVEGQTPGVGNVGGYGAMGGFGLGVLVVIAVGFYVYLVRD